MEVAVFTDSPHSAMNGKAGSKQFEVVLDPNELESNMSDVLLQVVATQQGITALHVDSVQRGGVPVGVLTSALAAGWEGVQAQHGRMKACIHQVEAETVLLHSLSALCQDWGGFCVADIHATFVLLAVHTQQCKRYVFLCNMSHISHATFFIVIHENILCQVLESTPELVFSEHTFQGKSISFPTHRF